ncbi:MAG: hypothetical protein PHO42_00475 [Candidatus Omnitrophica bacterium]|nr:hypothetical protein [Candidatus Omnitrophota bacterium]
MNPFIDLYKKLDLEEVILWLFIALLPFSEFAYFTFGGKRIGYCDFIIAGLFITWLIRYASKRTKFQRSFLELPFLILLGAFLISFINSCSFLRSISETAGLVYLMVFFLLIINIASSLEKLRRLLTIYLAVAAVVSFVGLYYFCMATLNNKMPNNPFLLFGDIEAMAHHFPRIRLFFESPNMLLTYLHVALVLGTILLLLQKNHKIKFLIFLSIFIILTAAFFTGSRRFTGLILSLFIILCWFGKGKVPSLLKYLSFLGFIFFFITTIATSIWVIFPIRVAKDEGAKTVNLRLNYAYSLHHLQQVAPIGMFKKHPVIGVGIGTYNKHFKEYVDWQWVRSSFGFEAYPTYIEKIENKTLNFDAHSVYLGAIAETGLLGGMALCYFFSSFLVLLVAKFKKAKYHSDFQKILSGCILAGLIGFLLNGVITDILYMRHFWFMLALGFLPILHDEKMELAK